MHIREILRSKIDRSMNLILEHPSGGKIETRSVQRTDETLIIYLSSDIGCNLSCRMCHLTQTGQVLSRPISVSDYCEQATILLTQLDLEQKLVGVKTIHYNFMAQGDALYNNDFVTQHYNIFHQLEKLALRFVPGVEIQFKISTIFPKDASIFELDEDVARMWTKLAVSCSEENIEFYYSLYSLKADFRKRWLPKAADPELVGRLFSGLDHGLRIHHALIAGLNDTEEDVALIHDWLERHDLHVKMNIVRYNPFDEAAGVESSEDQIDTYVNQLNLSHRIELVQIIPRVGIDCAASCGMFVEK